VIQEFTHAQHEDYLAWLKGHPDGYVWNVSHERLHLADCRFARSPRKADPTGPAGVKLDQSNSPEKICADTKTEIIDRVEAARDSMTYCGTCRP
jgi:hypothetical protein